MSKVYITAVFRNTQCQNSKFLGKVHILSGETEDAVKALLEKGEAPEVIGREDGSQIALTVENREIADTKASKRVTGVYASPMEVRNISTSFQPGEQVLVAIINGREVARYQ